MGLPTNANGEEFFADFSVTKRVAPNPIESVYLQQLKGSMTNEAYLNSMFLKDTTAL